MYIHNTNSSIKPHPGVRGGVFIFRHQEEGWGKRVAFFQILQCASLPFGESYHTTTNETGIMSYVSQIQCDIII